MVQDATDPELWQRRNKFCCYQSFGGKADGYQLRRILKQTDAKQLEPTPHFSSAVAYLAQQSGQYTVAPKEHTSSSVAPSPHGAMDRS